MYLLKPKPYCIIWNEPPRGVLTHLDWSSLTAAWPCLIRLVSLLSGVDWPLASTFANCLLWVPLSNSSGLPFLLPVASRSRAQSFVWFRAKTDKGIVCLADHLHSVTTKRMAKKLDGNYTRMLQAILNRSWRQHPTKQLLYGHLPPTTKTIQIWRNWHAGHCWRCGDELISGPLHMAEQKQGEQLEPTYSSSVRIRGVALRTCRTRWTIGRDG